jgi:dihydropteroate synthase
MGILNVAQLFFDGGKYKNETEILSQVEKMLLDGATFIDVEPIPANQMQNLSEQEEISRIVPVKLILKHFPKP